MTEIRQYTTRDQEKLKKYYLATELQKKQTRVLHALQKSQSAKRAWQAGLVGIFGLHYTSLKAASSFSTTLPTILFQVVLWSAGVGLFWYQWLCKKYGDKVRLATDTIAQALAEIQNNPKSNAWVMVNDKDEIIGTVALKCVNGEGQIGLLTGEEARQRQMLVQNAIRFGRTNKIQVISKWDQDSKCNFTIRTLTRSIDHFPMHHLFSPTALDHDLTYVDKTYYNALTQLDLSHNKLTKLPSSMDQLKHLKHLDISHNRLSQLPSGIYSLCKLTHFDMSHNPVRRVSANLARLMELSLLDLSSTEIISIPAELLTTLSMTTIKLENCQQLVVDELEQELVHNPPSLVETCARQMIQPILSDLIQNKKAKKKQQREREASYQRLPNHLLHYLSRPKACSTCGGPYFQSSVTRYRIVQRQDESWVPVEYKLCSAHWNNEKDRILALFSDIPQRALPRTTEPCRLRLVPSSHLQDA
ncbi:uncharacterized protein EV154DRAFT_545573 [Mucor mucedo]|uniref:uncharacterized protein n=1 Tax=Mucor mucedo TaxID=29922 RepID=UPI00222089E5|nr:uncharacterized protein EV154DRAFT_545573 [Mucor mucedo]KAI7881719.1 hypothetical protein EV154DRAFT_545573 [Mucor mucedo]